MPGILDEEGVKTPYKRLSRLMEGISSSTHGDFYCLVCFISFRTESTLKNHVDLCKNNKFANQIYLKKVVTVKGTNRVENCLKWTL